MVTLASVKFQVKAVVHNVTFVDVLKRQIRSRPSFAYNTLVAQNKNQNLHLGLKTVKSGHKLLTCLVCQYFFCRASAPTTLGFLPTLDHAEFMPLIQASHSPTPLPGMLSHHIGLGLAPSFPVGFHFLI